VRRRPQALGQVRAGSGFGPLRGLQPGAWSLEPESEATAKHFA